MDKVYEYLYNKIKLCENDKIVVAVSYGPDSMALLDILLTVRKKIKLEIIVAHVNHNKRRASKKEKILLERYCRKNNVIFEYMLIENYGNDNFHNEARKIRYEFFERLIEKYSAKYLMTAHHGDDLIETILMRISRGSTLRGYSGFSDLVDKGNYFLVRPLIFITKEQILGYIHKNKIPYALDVSNKSNKYTRNRYRKNIISFLKREDKNINEKYLKFSRILIENDNYINKIINSNIDKVYCENKIDINELKKHDQLIQNRIIEQIFSKIYIDDLSLIGDLHLHAIKDLVDSKKVNASIILPGNVKGIKAYNYVTFVKDENKLPSDYNILLNDIVFLPNGKTIKKISASSTDGNDICRLLSLDISLPLYVRNRKNGDRIEIKNTNGHTKIKDIFIDKKIPQEERDNWPIVVDSNDNIVWLPGLKKSKYNRLNNDSCDIILRYE